MTKALDVSENGASIVLTYALSLYYVQRMAKTHSDVASLPVCSPSQRLMTSGVFSVGILTGAELLKQNL